MLGVVKLLVPVPLFSTLPPVAALYQSITAPLDVALIATVPVPQREPAVPVGLAGTVFTVACTALREVDTQPVVLLRASA
jgi:hypothetical protein